MHTKKPPTLYQKNGCRWWAGLAVWMKLESGPGANWQKFKCKICKKGVHLGGICIYKPATSTTLDLHNSVCGLMPCQPPQCIDAEVWGKGGGGGRRGEYEKTPRGVRKNPPLCTKKTSCFVIKNPPFCTKNPPLLY